MKKTINFPKFSNKRCLMMPYIQGDANSVPEQFRIGYEDILNDLFIEKGEIGFLTIDESPARKGKAHRGYRSKTERAIHTEAGRHPDRVYAWGGGGWGSSHRVTLSRDTRILLANNVDGSCAIWDAVHEDTTIDGDIGHVSDLYPYSQAKIMKAGEVCEIGILTPHESLPVKRDVNRQFLRIVGSGVRGRETYFTMNPLVSYS